MISALHSQPGQSMAGLFLLAADKNHPLSLKICPGCPEQKF